MKRRMTVTLTLEYDDEIITDFSVWAADHILMSAVSATDYEGSGIKLERWEASDASGNGLQWEPIEPAADIKVLADDFTDV